MARRSLKEWREAVFQRRGRYCRVCGHGGPGLQADHVMPRSQGGEDVVENGIPLCGPFTPCGCNCHDRKTRREVRLTRAMLDDDTLEYLKEKQWAWWKDDGSVWGRGFKGFEPELPKES